MPKLILVVEDNPLVRDMLVQNLEEKGFTIIEAITVHSAWVLYQSNHHDLVGIFMDGQLLLEEKTDELVQKIRLSGFTRPIIAMSGIRNAELLKAGCDAALAKGGSPGKTLQEILHQWFR